MRTKINSLKFGYCKLRAYSYIAGIIWWMFSFPARLSADSLETLGYIKIGIFSQTHSVFYQFFISITSINGRFIGISSLIQVILMVYAVGRFLKVFFINASEKNLQIVRITVIASPFGGGIATTIWVDALSVIIFLLFISRIIELQNLFQLKKLLVAGWVGILFVGLRPETFYILILTGILIILISFLKSTQMKTSTGLQIISIAIIGFIVLTTTNHFSNSEPSPRFYKVAAPLHDLAYSSKILGDNTLEKNFANIIGDEGLQGSTYCPSSVPFLFAPGNNFSEIRISNMQVYKLWLLEFLDHPVELFKLHVCRAASFIPPPFSFSAKYVYLVHPGIDQNLIGYEFKPILRLNSSVVNLLNHALSVLLKYIFWPGLLLLVATILLAFKKVGDTSQSGLALAYIWSNSIVLFFVATAGDFRYGLNIVFVALPTTLFFLLDKITIRRG